MNESNAAAELAQCRWQKTTPEERSAATLPGREAHQKQALNRAVDRVVENAPKLTPEQLDRIGAILRGSK